MEKIEFTLVGDEFVSAPIKVTTDIGVNLEFVDGEKSTVILEQSMTGIVYQSFKVDRNVEKCYDCIIAGIIPDMFVRIKSSIKPKDANLLRKP